jgi:hypothetical protein
MRPFGNETGRAGLSPSSDQIDGGIFMSIKKHAAHPDPEFFPENVEFLGFMGGWDCDIGIDTVHKLFYLIRTSDLDWLEVVVKYSNKIIRRTCVSNIPRDGSKREAAARLLNAHVRARVHYDFPIPPYQGGLLTPGELEDIVTAVVAELDHNSRVAEEQQRQHEAPILKMAKELGLDPRPAGHNHNAWMANCPRTSHWLMISAEQNEFGCGYCRRKGGPAELRAFYETRYPRPG